MNCTQVQTRIVAYQDGELSPGETVRVAEHLDTCSDCREHERRLALVTPEPFVDIDDIELNDKWQRLDAAVAAELNRPLPVPANRSMSSRAQDWLNEEMPISTGAALAYAAALMLVAVWGAGNWKAAHDAQLALNATSTIDAPLGIPADDAGDEIQGIDYRPVAYSPDTDGPVLTEPTDER